ncbi:MAG: LPS assembly protein LptD [Pseudomonadota bacterium]
MASITRLVWALAALLVTCGLAAAQDLTEIDPDQPVTLIADEMIYDSASGQLTASGNVEVYFGERTLTADTITYDDTTRRISASGDIVLRDPTGTTVYASLVDLDSELTDGLIRGAQTIIGQQGKVAAVEGRRVEDRYNVLSKAVYSPCEVCQENPTPLWRIRARKIIHDEEEKIIHYENATFDLLGIPIFWTPYFRHPDPTVERASGFLTPSFRNSSNYGYGAQIPYYQVIDEQSDITLIPFITTDNGLIGEAVYRRAFRNGDLSIGGSLTHTREFDDGRLQGHLDTTGLFSFGDARWGWDVDLTTDDAYLRFFDFSNEDRLESEAFVYHYSPNSYYDGRLVYFQSLRDDEFTGDIPLVLPDFEARTELPDPVLGGEFGVFLDTAALFRSTDFEPRGADLASVVALNRTPGTDTARFSIGLDWERNLVLPMGLALTGFAEMRGDILVRRDDPSLPDKTSFRFAPLAGIEARYPLIWELENGDAHVIEPIAQAIVAPFGGNSDRFFNEDSSLTEFDETNLFDRSHFSGLDAIEEGPRLNLGMRYARISDDGLRLDASVGRVFRLRDVDAFTSGSGLSNSSSDWVAAWAVGFDPYVTIRQRLRVDEDFQVNRNEVGAKLSFNRFDITADYVFLESDPSIGQIEDREEVSAGATVRIDKNWAIRGFLQRDLQEREFVETGGGITYANECCEIDLFIRRRFTDSDDVPASTSVGVQVKLLTLGTSDSGFFDSLGSREDDTAFRVGHDR